MEARNEEVQCASDLKLKLHDKDCYISQIRFLRCEPWLPQIFLMTSRMCRDSQLLLLSELK